MGHDSQLLLSDTVGPWCTMGYFESKGEILMIFQIVDFPVYLLSDKSKQMAITQ